MRYKIAAAIGALFLIFVPSAVAGSDLEWFMCPAGSDAAAIVATQAGIYQGKWTEANVLTGAHRVRVTYKATCNHVVCEGTMYDSINFPWYVQSGVIAGPLGAKFLDAWCTGT